MHVSYWQVIHVHEATDDEFQQLVMQTSMFNGQYKEVDLALHSYKPVRAVEITRPDFVLNIFHHSRPQEGTE